VATLRAAASRRWSDLLLLDDFGLCKLTAQEPSDFYDVLPERDRGDGDH
jgi:hypothetical protein